MALTDRLRGLERAFAARLAGLDKLAVHTKWRPAEGEGSLAFLTRVSQGLPFLGMADALREPVVLLAQEVVRLRADVDRLQAEVDRLSAR